MAYTATAQVEVQTGGDDSFGGGNDPTVSGNVDRSQQTTAQVVIDNSAIKATCNGTVITFTNSTYTVLAGDKGNFVNMITGTGLSGANIRRYQITNVATGLNGTWTLDSTTGMSGGTVTSAKMGGALLSPGIGALVTNVAGMVLFIKNDGSGIYTFTTASSNVAGGTLSPLTGTYVCGYASNRTLSNTDARPTLKVGSGVSAASMTAAAPQCIQLIFDGNAQTTSRVNNNSSARYFRCAFNNCTSANGVGTVVGCSATGNSSTAFSTTFAYNCEASANTATPFVINGTAANCEGCISYNNTGAGTDGFSLAGADLAVYCQNVAYGNGRHGFSVSTGITFLVNCHAENQLAASTGAYNLAGTNIFLFNCGDFNNTARFASGSTTARIDAGIPTITTSVFVDASSNDFRLNDTPGGGSVLRGAGWFTGFPSATLTTVFLDIGAAQHADPGAIILAGGGQGMVNF